MKLKLMTFALLAFLAAGCDYQFREKPIVDENSANAVNAANKNENKSAAPSETNGTNNSSNSETAKSADTSPLIYSGTGEGSTIPCNGREVEFTEESTANSHTFTGECKKLTVDGVSNKITVEKVGEIVVKGISNKVTYTEGLDGKKPKISKSGTSTEVNSAKAAEEKRKAESK